MRTPFNIKVQTYRSRDTNEDIPYLISHNSNEILQLPVLYAVDMRHYVQSGTLTNKMQALKYLYHYAEKRGFNLDEYLTLSAELAPLKLENFIHGLFVFMQTGEANEKIIGGTSLRNEYVSLVTYWGNIKDYILYWLRRSIFKKDMQLKNKDNLNQLEGKLRYLEDMFKQFSPIAPRPQCLDILREGEIAKAYKIFNPKNSIFKSEGIRFRNYTMFQLFLDSGMRKGELLSLCLEDLPAPGNVTIVIKRRPDNLLDTRSRKPAVKGKSHYISVTPETIAVIDKYITHYRPDHASLPFVFLEQDGNKPLSIASTDKVFSEAKSKLCFSVNPHKLRRTRHYHRLWSLYYSKNNDDRDSMWDIVRQEGGWATEIPEAYRRQYDIDLSNHTAPKFLDELYRNWGR